ncbi:Uncharacterized protein GBIM_14156 [Gryllus bimaculatus]|nr:Uncharacterized protein GBIM_14156 [Gryllus bimaculatus]
MTHASAHTAHGVRVVAPPPPDSLAAGTAPQPEGQFGDRTRPVTGQEPVSTVGAWHTHPDVKVVLPPGLDDSLGPAVGDDGGQPQLDGSENSKAEGKPMAGEQKPTEEEKQTSDKPAEDDGTRQKLPDTHVVLPPAWDEPGFKPPVNDDAERGEGSGDDDDESMQPNVQLPAVDGEPGLRPPGEQEADSTKQKLPDTLVVLPPAWDEPGFRPPETGGVRDEGNKDGDDTRNKEPNTSVQLPPGYEDLKDQPSGDEEGVKKKENGKDDDTRQKLPDTLVVLPPAWDEPGFRPPENGGVRDEGNKEGDDTRNKEPNTSVQLPPGYEDLKDQPSGDVEGVKEAENSKDDDTRQKLPETLVILPPAWDEPGFRPLANVDSLRDEETQDNSKAPEQSDASPGQKPTPVKGESSSATPSGDTSPNKDSTKQDAAKETQKPAPVKSTTQTVKGDQSPPEKSVMNNDENGQKKNPEEGKEPAKPDETEPVDKPQDALPDSPQVNTKSGGAATADDPPPRLQVPPEFYLTRKNHAARPHVRPTPPPSEQPDFIAENPLFEWTFPCSSQEKSCLDEDRVLYDGDRKCYQLWRSGPCERGQWLVIDKAEALNGSGHFRAVCANMSRCPEREVFMASDRQCHPFAQIIREICPKHEGLQLSYNVFGEGECKCDNCPHPQLPTNTFGEGRCAFPPSFYRSGVHVGLEVAWRAAMAEAAVDAAGKAAGATFKDKNKEKPKDSMKLTYVT